MGPIKCSLKGPNNSMFKGTSMIFVREKTIVPKKELHRKVWVGLLAAVARLDIRKTVARHGRPSSTRVPERLATLFTMAAER